MDIQAINDEVPFSGIRIALHRLLNVGNKVGFRAGVTTSGSDCLACDHITHWQSRSGCHDGDTQILAVGLYQVLEVNLGLYALWLGYPSFHQYRGYVPQDSLVEQQ